MHDVAIVGAGLTGLELTRQLISLGLNVTTLDARPRPGGRILSHEDEKGHVDLGATWYWPESEPRITALIQSMGLATFPQPDAGITLNLQAPSQPPSQVMVEHLHGDARRITGGTAQLIEALVRRLPDGVLQLSCHVRSLIDNGDHVELIVQDDMGVETTLRARQVVLALPPRLILQTIRCVPELPDATVEALGNVPTWMALEAKSIARFDQPFWLRDGYSGNAFVSHQQAVLKEVWDASDTRCAALGGLHHIPVDQRPAFDKSLNLLVDSQLTQLFGANAQGGRVVTKDWSRDPWTCSALDRADAAASQASAPQAHPILRRPHWQGRLYFGGTETARQAAGHMEGALDSVARLTDFLRPNVPQHAPSPQVLSASLARFHQWVEHERDEAFPRYTQHLNHLLSRQEQERITQRAVLAAIEQTYSRALDQLSLLDMVPPSTSRQACEQITPQVLKAFSGFSKQLVDQALAHNANSCAMSNFQHEHQPDPEYIKAITADLAAAWMEFAWSTSDLIQVRARAIR